MNSIDGLLLDPADTAAAGDDSGPRPPRVQRAPIIGRLVAIGPFGEPLVGNEQAGGQDPIPARRTCAITADDVGRAVLIVFERGDPRRPVIIGVVNDEPVPDLKRPASPDIQLDGEALTFTACREIVLRCGRASITLTRAGKVLIRGAYVLSRSSGVNRIKGGSVQIN